MIILGIETSCDDTGIGIVDCSAQNYTVLANIVSSQIKIHAPYGGIVPNLAARAHLDNLGICLKQALEKAGRPRIDLIGVTIGPGLIPCLLIGTNFAKALGYSQHLPLRGVNHLQAHVYANWLNNRKINRYLPGLALIVSGGHTQLVLVKNTQSFKLIGQTNDDAAGEAFDKVAKLLGLGYPGGPLISQRAEKGDPSAIALPRPMLHSANFDFSFSGLKTAVLYQVIRKKKLSPLYINNLSASFQQAVIDVLIAKTIKAAKENRVKSIMLAGGVAANQQLGKQMKERITREMPSAILSIPSPQFCTDNGVMVALAAYFQKNKSDRSTVRAQANLSVES